RLREQARSRRRSPRRACGGATGARAERGRHRYGQCVMEKRIDVGILGATGVVGQHFVALLADHPWFRVTWLAASERSAGQRYGDLAWRLPARQPADVAALRVSSLDQVAEAPSILFSGLDSSVAGEAELAFAASGRHV